MANQRKVRNLPSMRIAGLEAAFNELVDALEGTGLLAHHKTTDLITTANASSLATSKTLAAALGVAIVAHDNDSEIHTAAGSLVAPAAWTSSPSEPADLTEVQNVLNELKTDWNAHIVDTTIHRGVFGPISGDGVLTPQVITTANATDQDTANALANALKSAFNIHAKSATPDIVLVAS